MVAFWWVQNRVSEEHWNERLLLICCTSLYYGSQQPQCWCRGQPRDSVGRTRAKWVLPVNSTLKPMLMCQLLGNISDRSSPKSAKRIRSSSIPPTPTIQHVDTGTVCFLVIFQFVNLWIEFLQLFSAESPGNLWHLTSSRLQIRLFRSSISVHNYTSSFLVQLNYPCTICSNNLYSCVHYGV